MTRLRPIRTEDLDRRWAILFATWVVAVAATLGALFIGEFLGKAPCYLCWHQRVFMFPLAVILGIASWRSDDGIAPYALPLALIGWLIAAVHLLLFWDVIPRAIEPCGAGPSCSGSSMTIFGFLPLPLLSLLAFTLIATGLFIVMRGRITHE